MRAAVWYKKEGFFEEDPNLTMANLTRNHRQVGILEDAKDLEDAFCRMQGEVWSPNGEARPLIIALGLHHTSMSVGDVVVDENGDGWEVENAGFRKLAEV